MIKESLTHEAIHAYDYTNNKCDFHTCEGLAYTEVRAAREAECSGPYMFEWFRELCIKANASNATENMFPSGARKCVNSVYAAAVTDYSPLDDTLSLPGSSATNIHKDNRDKAT